VISALLRFTSIMTISYYALLVEHNLPVDRMLLIGGQLNNTEDFYFDTRSNIY
jgi:hypothetical protein